jgi:hypothetical protein
MMMLKALQEWWGRNMIWWPGTDFTRFQRVMVILMTVMVLMVLGMLTASAGSAQPPDRRKLDSMPDIELCSYRASMVELMARYWNLGKRDWKEIYAMMAWHGDETEFEKALVEDTVKQAFEYFIPEYIAGREKAGKPASTLITYQVGEEYYEKCKYAIENAHKDTSGESMQKMGSEGAGWLLWHKTASGQPMQETNSAENFQRASDALYAAFSKSKGKTIEQLIHDLEVTVREYDVDPRRYAWIVEYINRVYADKGDPWQWYLREIGAK